MMKRKTKNTIKVVKNKNGGITLIALVITIIVLLILAGISISMLSGDNGILQKATDAKQTSERAEAKEQAQIDIMAWITDKTANHQNASLDDTKIKAILSDNKSYVKEAKDTSFITAKGEYEIPYSELYELTKNHSSSDTSLSFGTVNEEYKTKFGYLVTGYNSTSGSNWRLFYADSDNAYLISDSIGNQSIGNFSWFGESEVSDLCKNLNKKFTNSSSWDLKSDGTNINDNIKAVTTLLDPTKWTEYKSTEANWAIGAPTLEMFIASYNATHSAKIDCSVEENATGYKIGFSKTGNEITSYNTDIYGMDCGSELDSGIYFTDSCDWVLASPHKQENNIFYVGVDVDEWYGKISNVSYDYNWNAIRPLVSIPLSKINVDGNTVTVLP